MRPLQAVHSLIEWKSKGTVSAVPWSADLVSPPLICVKTTHTHACMAALNSLYYWRCAGECWCIQPTLLNRAIRPGRLLLAGCGRLCSGRLQMCMLPRWESRSRATASLDRCTHVHTGWCIEMSSRTTYSVFSTKHRRVDCQPPDR